MKRYMTLMFAISYFLLSIILIILDYYNVFSALGFGIGNINWDFTGMVIANMIVVLLFVITYETLDRRSAEKENNKRLIAISLIKQSYEQCVWYTNTLSKEIVEKYIVPKMNFDGGADENKVVMNLKNAPFENDGAILSLVYDGQISVETINSYFKIKQLFSQYSDSTLSKCRTMLYQIFNRAIASDMLTKNPVAFVEKQRKQPKKRKESFTPEEVQLLMEHLSDDRIGWSIRLLLASGMREGELLALEPRHISEQGDWICVEQAVVRIKGSVAVGPTKTAGSTRLIPVPECVQYCARRLRDTDKKFIWEVGKPGMPCNPSHFVKKYKEAVGRVNGVRVLSPHSCRHTYISMLQMLNVNFETIRDLSGHVHVDMTRHYLHVQEPSRLEAARKFSEAFSWKEQKSEEGREEEKQLAP